MEALEPLARSSPRAWGLRHRLRVRTLSHCVVPTCVGGGNDLGVGPDPQLVPVPTGVVAM